MPDIAYHRLEAARCRALAGTCLYHVPRDVLLSIAAEHEAKAARIEAARAKPLAVAAVPADKH